MVPTMAFFSSTRERRLWLGALGLLDECLQLFVPSRVFDPWDILFNVLAGALAVGASVALGWARRRAGRRD